MRPTSNPENARRKIGEDVSPPRGKGRVLLGFTRPFTLLPPLLGVISGAVTAFGSVHNPDPSRSLTLAVLATVGLGSLCAALLNAASNGINQIYDLEIDRRNKPGRPLVSGALTLSEGWWFSVLLYVLAIVPTWLVVIYPVGGWEDRLAAPLARHECFLIYLAGMLLTLVYSVPALGRTKRHGLWANITIAVPRGCLLKVAGWSMVATALCAEPWYIGFIFFLFLLGASTTKDFSDMEGDRAHGCHTLPIRYGVRRSAYLIAPFFVAPWLLMPLGTRLADPFDPARTILSGHPGVLSGVGGILTLWGAYTAYLIIRRPEELTELENHPSWTHMYLMMMFAQVGFAIAYLV